MSAITPTIYVIAGCNGEGKTTFAKEYAVGRMGQPRSSRETARHFRHG
jgi:hypothetical protein